MSDIYQITLTTQTGEWRYFYPDSVEQFHFVPVLEQLELEE